MITQSFDLNLIPDSSPVVVHCDQYDRGTGRLVISLYNGNVSYTPTGTAKIQGRKPDGKGFEYSATFSGNVVTANLTEQMTAVAGRVQTQIVVTETTGRTGTFVFILDVQRSALPANTDMSESEYQIVEELLDEVEEIRPELQGYVDAAEDFSEDAEAWAEGKRGGVPVAPSDPTYQHNSKYWSDVASQYAQGGLIYKGSCTFANIPTTGMIAGDMWNIEDAFTTDSRFQEGAGVSVAAGTNIAWNPNSKWDVLATGGGGGDYVGLYGMTEIQSSDGQGTTLLDLDQYTSVGNYYCNGKAQISVSIYRYTSPTQKSGSVTTTYFSAIFILYVRKMPNNDTVQEMYIKEGDATVYAVLRRYKNSNGWTYWSAGESRSYNGKMPVMYLYSLQGVYIDTESDGDVFVYDGTNSQWENKPINKATTFSVSVSGWTSDTTSQSGTTLYKKQISVNHVHVESPTVDIGCASASTLPTKAEQVSYNLLQYATVDDTVPCLYLYASEIPTTAFYINVKGVD